MANSDVKAKRLTGTGAASIGRARLRQIQVLTGGGAGRLTLTDGNGGSVNIPDEGILFSSDVHVSVATNVTALTIFHS